jgi:hypothetical protein
MTSKGRFVSMIIAFRASVCFFLLSYTCRPFYHAHTTSNPHPTYTLKPHTFYQMLLWHKYIAGDIKRKIFISFSWDYHIYEKLWSL